MAVRVECPHCRSVCQVDDRHLGATVKCGNCAKLFAARTSAPATVAPEDDLPFDLDGPEAAANEPQSTPAPELHRVPLGAGCLDIGAATSPGHVRPRNEDSFLVQQLSWSNLDRRREMALVIIADGLGGHEAGDRASRLVTRTIAGSLASLFTEALTNAGADLSPPRLSDAVRSALHDANRAVYARAQKQPECRGMGATVAAVLVLDGQAVIGHVGDCRVYHHAGESWRQLTRDQTFVARMVELGQISEAEAKTHPSRNEVTQAIGRHAELDPSLYEAKLATGDSLLAASDGLHAHVDGQAMQAALRETPSALALAHHLVRLADQGGGSDNCTVAAIRFC